MSALENFLEVSNNRPEELELNTNLSPSKWSPGVRRFISVITFGLWPVIRHWLVAKRVREVSEVLYCYKHKGEEIKRAIDFVEKLERGCATHNRFLRFVEKRNLKKAHTILNKSLVQEKKEALNTGGKITQENLSLKIQEVLDAFYKKPLPKKEEVTVPVQGKDGKVEMFRWVELDKRQQDEIIRQNRKGRGKKLFGGYGVKRDWEWSEDHIPRWKHGCMHMVRSALAIKMIAELLKKYDPDFLINDEDILLAQYLIVFHDSARQADGVDVWDDQSAENARVHLEELGFDEATVEKCVQAIKEKDAEEKTPLAKLIHDGDCLDIIRVRQRSFDESRLDSFRDVMSRNPLRKNEFLAELHKLKREYAAFVKKTERPLIKVYLEEQSKDYYGDLLSLAVSRKDKKPCYPMMQKLLIEQRKEVRTAKVLKALFHAINIPSGAEIPDRSDSKYSVIKRLGKGGIHEAVLLADRSARVVFRKKATPSGVLAEVGASQIASFITGGLVPKAHGIEKGKDWVEQDFIPMRKELFSSESIDREGLDFTKLSEEQREQLFVHFIADKATANYDTHASQFRIDSEGRVIAFDKGQAFKLFGKRNFTRKGMPKRIESEALDPELKWNPDLHSVYDKFAAYLESNPEELARIFESQNVQEAFKRCTSIDKKKLQEWLGDYARQVKGNEADNFLEKVHGRLQRMESTFADYFFRKKVIKKIDELARKVSLGESIERGFLGDVSVQNLQDLICLRVRLFQQNREGGYYNSYELMVSEADLLIKLREMREVDDAQYEELSATAAILYQEALMALGAAGKASEASALTKKIQNTFPVTQNNPLSDLSRKSISSVIAHPTLITLDSTDVQQRLMRVTQNDTEYCVELFLEHSLRRRLQSLLKCGDNVIYNVKKAFFHFGELPSPGLRRGAKLVCEKDLGSWGFCERQEDLTETKPSIVTFEVGRISSSWNLYPFVRIVIPKGDDGSGFPQDFPNKLQRAFSQMGLPALGVAPRNEDLENYKKVMAVEALYPHKFLEDRTPAGVKLVCEKLKESELEEVERCSQGMQMTEVLPGFHDFVLPDLARETWLAGGRGLGSGIQAGTRKETCDVFAKVLSEGQASQLERCLRGNLGGVLGQTFRKGSANRIFFRQLVQGQFESNFHLTVYPYAVDGMFILYKQQLAERPSMSHDRHMWGVGNLEWKKKGGGMLSEVVKPGSGHGVPTLFTGISGEEIARAKKRLLDLVTEQQKKYSGTTRVGRKSKKEYSEVTFNQAVLPKYIYGVVVPDEQYKKLLIETLQSEGIKYIDGREIDQCIYVGDHLTPEMMSPSPGLPLVV